MLEIFQVAAEAVGTCVKRFATIAEAVAYVRELAGESAISSSQLPREISEAFSDFRLAPPHEIAETRLCVSYAHAGLAATGSLLLDLSNHNDRSATALSFVHAVFLKASTIVPNFDSLSDLISERLNSSQISRLSLTTGPSRTADIERVLTIGVHGPKELHVLVMEGE